jgi:hypothetical protein
MSVIEMLRQLTWAYAKSILTDCSKGIRKVPSPLPMKTEIVLSPFQ